MRRRLTAVAALLVVLALGRPASADLLVGVELAGGRAHVPSGVGGGFATRLTLHDYGGFMSKIWLLWAASPKEPAGKFEGSWVEKSCRNNSCTITQYSAYTPPTEEQWEAYSEAKEEWPEELTRLMALRVPWSSDLTLSLPMAGSDTLGLAYQWQYHWTWGNLVGFRVADLALGFGWQFHNIEGRDRKPVVINGGTFTPEEDDILHAFIGVPLTFSGSLARNLSLQLQLDLNFWSAVADFSGYSPSLLHVRLIGKGAGFALIGGVTSETFAPGSYTFSFEVARAL